jgi:OOP family OmpA-OmpF porin
MTHSGFAGFVRHWPLRLAAVALALLLAPGPLAAQPAAAPASHQLSLVREGDLVVLGGSLADEEMRARVLGAIRAVSTDIAVIDTTELVADLPPGFASASAWAAGLVAHLKPGSVLLSGSEVTVKGRPDGAAGQAAVAAALGQVPAGFALLPTDLAPPPARPFVLTLERTSGGVTLGGVVASAAERDAILAFAASLPLGAVSGDVAVAGIAPDAVDRLAVARFTLTQLARLKSGAVRIEDGALSLEGEPADRAGFAAVTLALRASPLPGGVSLKAVRLEAPVVSPYRWTVEKSAAGLRLQGYVPSDAVRAATLAAAEALFAPLVVADEQVVARGAPAGFDTAVVAAMGHLVLLDRGRATLSDAVLAISGDTGSATAAAAARAAIEGSVPFGFTVSHVIAAPAPPVVVAPPPAPPACLATIATEMAAGGVVFQFGREAIRPESIARLGRIAEAMKACPTVRFSVEGHTDSDGIASQNVDLSHRRAQAVVATLIRQGIDAGRLLSEGHGATKPLVPNDSPANKARNRRIEIVAR